jgi:hypothetical protein
MEAPQRNMNNPFEQIEGDEYVMWGQNRREINDIRIPLELAKLKIRRVQMNEFYTIFENSIIPNYLIDVYYFHYLCMLGDFVRVRNFVLDLIQRNIEIARVANYPLPEFDYGNVLHTYTRWNNNTEMFDYLIENCDADTTQRDSFGFAATEVADYDDFMYSFPFTDYLGEGESPVENDKIYRRIEENFDQMRIKMNQMEQELDVADGQEEEPEDNIEVIIPEAPQLERQNAVFFDEEEINHDNINNVRRVLFPANNNEVQNNNERNRNVNNDFMNFMNNAENNFREYMNIII